MTRGALGQTVVHVDVARPACAGQLGQELRRVDRRLLGRVGIDTLLPTRRGLGSEPQPPRGAQHGEGVEVRRLEEEVGRLRTHLTLLAAHDPGDRDGMGRVRNHQVGARQPSLLTVERPHLLPGACAANDDPPPVEPIDVERVQRRPEREHHVVRHVDDVRDRAHACGEEPCLQPVR